MKHNYLKRIYLFFLIILLAGCGTGVMGSGDYSNDANPTSTAINSTGNSTGNNSIGNNDSTVVSTPDPVNPITIAEALALAGQLEGSDALGETVAIKGKYLSYYADGNEHVAAIVDETGIMHVRHPATQSIKYYIGTSYLVTGKVSKHYSHIELFTSDLFTTTADVNVDIADLATDYDSIADIFTVLVDLPLSDKGTVFTDIIRFDAKYILKADDAVLLVTDDVTPIGVHGDDKINNSFILNNIYTFIGIIGVYQHRPSIEYLSATKIGTGEIVNNYPTAKTLTALTAKTLVDYNENFVYYPYFISFTGYVEWHQIGNNEFYILVDQIKPGTPYVWSTLQSKEHNAEGLYIRNVLYGTALGDMLEYSYLQETLIKVQLVLYDRISNYHAWFVHIVNVLEVNYEI